MWILACISALVFYGILMNLMTCKMWFMFLEWKCGTHFESVTCQMLDINNISKSYSCVYVGTNVSYLMSNREIRSCWNYRKGHWRKLGILDCQVHPGCCESFASSPLFFLPLLELISSTFQLIWLVGQVRRSGGSDWSRICGYCWFLGGD